MNKPVPLLLAVLFSSAFAALAESALKVADPFTDNMILQRGMEVPVWGEAVAGARVSVSFAGQTKTAVADEAGEWKVILSALLASRESRVMHIESGASKVDLKDVLVGEVWLCSGQSNMDAGVFQFPDSRKDTETANDPLLRLRVLKFRAAEDPQKHFTAFPWRLCTVKGLSVGSDSNPDSDKAPTGRGNSQSFSAVAYYFGAQLRRELNVPVGVIQASWGGTSIEAWTPAKEPSGTTGFLPAAKRAGIPPHKLYNALIAPWVGFGIRGVIWYQGEANCLRRGSVTYAEKMRELVGGWRQVWGRSDESFPFYFVQIAPFAYHPKNLDVLGYFWEEQVLAAQTIPNTGMAHIQDIGDPRNQHPGHKDQVGARLARLALNRTYGLKTQAGQPIVDDCGPQFKAMERKGNRVLVSFDHVKSGLSTRDGQAPTLFEVAGSDGKFELASARIDGDKVVVTSDKVAAPSQVRLGWLSIAEPNLMNGDKLPAASFRAGQPK